MIRHVVWDWNGTLLDDVDHSVASLNALLVARGMPHLDRASYRSRFGFPVREFYVGLGFDFAREDFARVSESFIERYCVEAQSAVATTNVLGVLGALRDAQVEQSVVSAMEHTLLQRMLGQHGLLPYLRHVRGTSDLHASSKVDLGRALMRELQAHPDEVVFVGDTLHDHETALAMGCHCLLYTQGHQTQERLHGSGATLIASLDEVVAFVHARRRHHGEHRKHGKHDKHDKHADRDNRGHHADRDPEAR